MSVSFKYVVIIVIVSFASFKIKSLLTPPPLPILENKWWGPGIPEHQDESIRNFKINVSEDILTDLQYRLENHKPLIPPLEGVQQQYGMNTNLLKEIIQFWKTKYDWREREKYLNQYPQYVTNIQGLDIHFIRVKPTKTTGLKIIPLLLLHGWPGSVREFYEIIPLLTTPREGYDFVFEVIVPSLPGYGFSQASVRPGLGAAQMSLVFKNLMNRLGFNKFYVQGGDFGAIILQHMSILYPDSVLGFHSNMCTDYRLISFLKIIAASVYPSLIVKEGHENRIYPLSVYVQSQLRETGYLHIQATKPDTVGVGVTDSPIGLAAYILEKFITGTNKTYILRDDGGLKEVWSYTDLLDNIMIYWITGSATTSFRLYSETFNKAHRSLGITSHPVEIPSACARFENDLYAPDGILKSVYTNLVHLSDHKGGHFAAFQLPKVLAEDIFIAINKFINIKE